MAHIHGEKMVETAAKVADKAKAGMMMGEMMGSGMEGMKGMGGMMGSGMEGMKGMGGMMGSGSAGMMMPGMNMAKMMTPGAMAAGAATGAAVTSHSLLRRVVTHPLVLFGIGVAIGYLVHKYRDEIIQKAGQVTE